MAAAVSFNSRSLPPPTAEQVKRWELIRANGCICCVPRHHAEIHHQTIGGRHGAPRLGHGFTVGLCAWHHRGAHAGHLSIEEMEAWLGPSLARTPKAFRMEYGDDEYMLRVQNELIGWTKPPVRERKRKSRCTTQRALPRRYGP